MADAQKILKVGAPYLAYPDKLPLTKDQIRPPVTSTTNLFFLKNKLLCAMLGGGGAGGTNTRSELVLLYR